jgi:ABC-type microcin C transport system duplicated ATPase subunit YejF
LAILRLLPGKVHVRGSVILAGTDLMTLSEKELRKVRGRRIGMVFQEPRAALNPLLAIGRQLVESVRVHRSVSNKEATQRGEELLEAVGILDPGRVFARYPHELSIGECQRVLLAASLAGEPELLICDEPTSALDGLHRMHILSLLDRLRSQRRISILLITQDLRIAKEFCDRHAHLPALVRQELREERC